MLLQRVITALVLLPLLLGAVWYAPTPGLYAIFCGVAVIMAWEWCGFMGVADRGKRIAYMALSGAVLAGVWMLPQRAQLLPWILGIAAAWWVFVITLFPGFPGNFERSKPGVVPMSLLGLLLMLSTMLSLAWLHGSGVADRPHDGALRLLYTLFIVFCADTGAYFAGRALGKHKLALNISPGKTIEGAIGGLLLCSVWALTAGAWVFRLEGGDRWIMLGLTLVVAMISIVGDLTESMFKRAVGLKDSGSILPGHGGILDRVDAILAAAPVMVLGLMLTGL